MNGYDLSRSWFNWCFENPEKIKPVHTALYFFIIEHCNRMGWVEKFGLPTEMAKTAIGVSNYRTYTNTINELEQWGFIKFIQRSQNQYSSNIIAIVKNTTSHTKALDKALHKHSTKHCISTAISTDSINKQITNNKEQRTDDGDKSPTHSSLKYSIDKRQKDFMESLVPYVEKYGKDMVREFFNYWTEKNKPQTKMKWELQQTFEVTKRLATWASRDKNFENKDKKTSITVNV
jgi:ATP-dependent Lon protease